MLYGRELAVESLVGLTRKHGMSWSWGSQAVVDHEAFGFADFGPLFVAAGKLVEKDILKTRILEPLSLTDGGKAALLGIRVEVTDHDCAHWPAITLLLWDTAIRMHQATQGDLSMAYGVLQSHKVPGDPLNSKPSRQGM